MTYENRNDLIPFEEVESDFNEHIKVIQIQEEIRVTLERVHNLLEETAAQPLPPIHHAGSYDYEGRVGSWPTRGDQREAKIELYKMKDNETYIVNCRVFESLELSDIVSPVEIECEKYQVAFPNGLLDPLIQRPFGHPADNVSSDELWVRLYRFLQADI